MKMTNIAAKSDRFCLHKWQRKCYWWRYCYVVMWQFANFNL